MPSKVKVIAVFQIEVEMPQGLKQKEWERQIRNNLVYPGSLGTPVFYDDTCKVKLVGKKVRYE